MIYDVRKIIGDAFDDSLPKFYIEKYVEVVSMISRRLNKCSQIRTILKAYIISCLLISIVTIC